MTPDEIRKLRVIALPLSDLPLVANGVRRALNGAFVESEILDAHSDILATEVESDFAELVVAAINALPALLDAVEALEAFKKKYAYMDFLPSSFDGHVSHECWCHRGMNVSREINCYCRCHKERR